MTDCCAKYLIPGALVGFHEWDEVFNAEVITLWLKGYICEFCGQSYYLAIKGEQVCTGKKLV